MNNQEVWQAVLAQIQLNISAANFATWFKDTKIVNRQNGLVVIQVPNSFVKEWLEQKYNKIILKILRSLDKEIKGAKYEIGKSGLKVFKKDLPTYEEGQLGFQEFRVNKETNLNPRYTFETFVVGSFNELAHAAAVAVSKNPGSVYNPLFIYGGVGLGKTHLLEAIGNEIVRDFPKKRVKYIPTEKFVSQVVSAIRNRQIEKLKSKYQAVDVLIVDDIQFITGKEKTQEEFFYIFNSLYEKNKQIILSSDRQPRAIPTLTKRLESRFEGGMIADISLPDVETRMAILKEKCQERMFEPSEEILNYIASNIQKNIRELEGALNILIAYQKVNGLLPDIKTTKSLLSKLTSSPKRVVNAKKIIKAVGSFYDLREKDIISSSRKKELVKPRHIVMYLLREELNSSFPSIGRKLGNKDHTTAIYGYEKIAKEINQNDDLFEEINMIKQRILSG